MLESIPNYLSVLLLMVFAYFLLTSFFTLVIDKAGDAIALIVSLLRVDPDEKK
jgi:K+-sensing histidine kinase KdpD